MDKKYKFKTRAIRAGFSGDATGAVMPPIYLSTTYKQREPAKPIGDFEYSRSSNPNRTYLEKALASLEGGSHGLCFSSGCAALATLLQSLTPHSHVVIGDDVYGGTIRLFEKVFVEKGITFSQIDCSDPITFQNALTPNTQLIWIETPSNPMLKITNITQICEIKSQHAPQAYVFIDNTFATPYLQNPLDCGADGVCHSTTKYIGGHSDVVGGALIVNDNILAENLRFYQNAMGAVPSPMDCFLLLRSLKTLGIRMEAHCKNAEKIIDFLSTQSCVKKIHYPGLNTHRHHDVARTQMRGFGGMISVSFNFNLEQIKKLLSQLELFTLAESLGGVESLIEHPALMTHATVSPQQRKLLGIDDGLLRLSIGIEEPDDLIDDLKQALTNL